MPARVHVIALGGSILAPDGPDVAYTRAFADLVGERLAKGDRVLVVTGGGRPARRYIMAARNFGLTEDALDEVGIAATRLNAHYLAGVLRARCGATVATEIHTTTAATAALIGRHRVAVMGGTTPGHSTDHVAAALATAAEADRLYVATNVDGVYTADPRRFADAERLPELTTARLVEIVGGGWEAGRAGVVDPSCAAHAHRERLPITVLDGRNIANLRAALDGDPKVGSRVTPGD